MSSTRSSGPGSTFGTIHTEPGRQVRQRSSGAKRSFPSFTDSESLEVLSRFGKKFHMAGIDLGSFEVHELMVLLDFLENNVQENRICDVQCMHLWNEWVRKFRSRIYGFPALVREKEFREVITDTFGIEIVSYGARGPVYPGIKFVR